jgi:hypothetical protein
MGEPRDERQLKRNLNPKIFGRPYSDRMSINILLADYGLAVDPARCAGISRQMAHQSKKCLASFNDDERVPAPNGALAESEPDPDRWLDQRIVAKILSQQHANAPKPQVRV